MTRTKASATYGMSQSHKRHGIPACVSKSTGQQKRVGRGDHFLRVEVGTYGTVLRHGLQEHSAPGFYQRNKWTLLRFQRGRATVLGKSRGKSSIMRLSRILVLAGCYLTLLSVVSSMPAEDGPTFEIPIQLLGFPVIIAAVRISNFVRKLAYSLNPDTYVNRVKRAIPLIHNEEILDVGQIEKKLVEKLGNNVCVYERICAKYASRTLQKRSRERVLDWDVIFSEYKSSPNPMKENYLLSVFLGDIIGSPRLCHQLAKRGRACVDETLSD